METSLKTNLRPFKLHRVYLEPLNSSNVRDFSWSWILKGFYPCSNREGKICRSMSTPSTKRRIGRFHVVVLQWTSKKRTKKCDARAEQLFCSENQSLLKVLNSAWAARVSARCSFSHSVESVLYSVFIWRHGDHIGVPKPWNGGHVGVPNKSGGSWTLFLCKHFLLFQ